MPAPRTTEYDWIIVGSGFGGSVSALRLAERGYSVLVIEKGKRFAAADFAKSNWDLRRWMWMPSLGMRGIFHMSFLEHVTVLHGIGVGGGSLVYANTLPVPRDEFFEAKSWAHLADWKKELAPHYPTAQRMLGSARNPRLTRGDELLREVARDIGREDRFEPTDVAVYFGQPGVTVKDPYFGGEGPDRTGCNFCGACMTGCRVGAKNTLDRNYLHLAERRGAEVLPETEVVAVRPSGADDGSSGYVVETRPSFGLSKPLATLRAKRVVFAGGVMGTVPLLLRMREDPKGLPRLSPRVGDAVRTNSEALIGVMDTEAREDFSKGVAITSIVHTDDHSHIEPVRYAAGSGFFRLLLTPHVPQPTFLGRLAGAARAIASHPIKWLRAFTVDDWAKRTQVLLYMRTIEGTLSFRLGRGLRTGFQRDLVSKLDNPADAPRAFLPEATDLADRFAAKFGGAVGSLATETVLGVPSTAHILGGACMGRDAEEGVIDAEHRVHGYQGLYVLDGASISANPGVNPSLTITTLAERAMNRVPPK